jgi:hypothetical protein
MRDALGFAQCGGTIFRHCVVKKGAGAGFDSGKVFQLCGTTLDREELNMEVKVRIIRTGWNLPNRHDQRELKSVEVVVFFSHQLDQRGQVGLFGRRQRCEAV